MTALMILYAAAIPLVPWWGMEYFKKRQEQGKRLVCMGLFVMQLFLSGAAVYLLFFS